MHYYKKNIGDYAKKAGRLSMLQHGAYTLLIDSCYDREQFPTLDEAIDWTWASSKEEIEAVEFVLKKFFTLDGDVYVQKRIKDTLTKYHENSEINKRIAIEREAKRKQKSTERERSVDEPPPNQEPRTTNQEPKKKIGRFTAPTLQEVKEYSHAKNLNTDGFHDFYESNGWKVGKNKMKDWQAAARGWSNRNAKSNNFTGKQNAASTMHDTLKQIANEAHKQDAGDRPIQ